MSMTGCVKDSAVYACDSLGTGAQAEEDRYHKRHVREQRGSIRGLTKDEACLSSGIKRDSKCSEVRCRLKLSRYLGKVLSYSTTAVKDLRNYE